MSASTPRPRPVYIEVGTSTVFGFLHPPRANLWRELAVLICPPFGWDDVCSYRSRRQWASHLADGGYASLRIDLPGSGDSAGSPLDPERLEAWIAATGGAAAWLRSHTGARRVAAIGIGLGGLVATSALAGGAAIDDLVLWATPARGRALVRELRAFASLEAAGLSPNRARGRALQAAPAGSAQDAPDERRAHEQLEAGGFVMSAETVAALAALDLAKLAIPDGAGRAALMLERDGLPVDARLSRHLETQGLAVASAPAEGYGAMMAEPQEALAPTDVFATVDAWLQGRCGRVDRPAYLPDGEDGRSEPPVLELGDAGVRETPFVVERPSGELFGILAEPLRPPASELCVVFLNAGAIHRIGPNRMWVEVARRWAARGIVVLRIDLPALGDAEGDDVASRDPSARYAPETIADIRAILDDLQERGVASRFALGGLCSGAYWSLRAAVLDGRPSAILLLNPAVFSWDPDVANMRDLRAGLHSAALWRRALRGDASLRRALALVRWSPRALLAVHSRVSARVRARRRGGDELDLAFDALAERGTSVMLAFSEREPLHEEIRREGRLRRLERMPNVTLESLPGVYHGLRELPAQRAAHEALDRALARELDRIGAQEHGRAVRVAAAHGSRGMPA